MGTIIKAGQSDVQALRRLETIDLADHVVEAARIVNAARRRAEQMIAQATSAAERIRQNAEAIGHASGYAKGEAEGRQAGHAQALQESTDRYRKEQALLRQALQNVVNELEDRKRDLLIEAEHDLLMFAVRVAEKVTRCAVQIHPEAAAANVRAVLRLIGAKTDLRVHLNPSDLETLNRFAAEYARELAQPVHVRLIEEPSITPGGCRVQTDETDVDATIDTQLEQIVRLILPGWESKSLNV